MAYGVAAVSAPRLEGDSGGPSSNTMTIQVALNDVARSVSGHVRTDHVRVQDLLAEANMPSYNALAVGAVAMETWKDFHSTDGSEGTRNPPWQHYLSHQPS